MPILSKPSTLELLNNLITILSPNLVGTMLNLTSTSIPPLLWSFTVIAPSCGNLLSEISQPAIIFSLVTTGI